VDSLIRVACQFGRGDQSRTDYWLEVAVLIAGFPAGAFAANCYVLAPGPDAECLIIDPGQEAEPGIDEILARYRLHPVAVLATHGHVDHIWSIAPVCDGAGIPAYIHPADRALLTDPGRGISGLAGRPLFGGITFREPADVLELADGMTIDLAGIQLIVDHAPGHTPGSVTFRLPGEPQAGTLFTGDLLFAGSIGRTDLPGGDYQTILDSLSRVCLPLPDETIVLAGHGPRTTIGAERASNQFLTGLEPAAGGYGGSSPRASTAGGYGGSSPRADTAGPRRGL
jgi:glyoxylase-like metal-dependent hydrolase (beta-lactamase superfamily II)